ncbi:Haptoglobin [Manis pentadactyla]|nr:Haptoglobin [Manis pentadactyla]
MPPEIENGRLQRVVHYEYETYYKLHTEGDGVYSLNNEKQWVNDVTGEKLPECKAVCGKPKNPVDQVQRIMGGSLDAKGSFPWQAKMVSHHNLTSGATLINEQWLLTTAKNLFLGHTDEAKAKDIAPTLRLYVGKHQLVEIEKVVLHPDHSKVDIGLVKLKQKVPIDEKYVMLPVAGQDKCVIHYEGSTVPEKKTPKSPIGVQPVLNEHTFCAGLSKYQEDTCYGDAGSAFAVHDTDEDIWYAAGVLSFDKSCTVAEYSVYVKVPSILDWVQKTVAEN